MESPKISVQSTQPYRRQDLLLHYALFTGILTKRTYMTQTTHSTKSRQHGRKSRHQATQKENKKKIKSSTTYLFLNMLE